MLVIFLATVINSLFYQMQCTFVLTNIILKTWGSMLWSSCEYEDFFIRYVFVFKTAFCELYFAKQFYSGNYNKIFFVFVLLYKT